MDRSLRPRKGRPVRVFWEDKRGPVIRLGGAQTCLSAFGKPGPKTYRAREPSHVRNRTPAVHFSRVTPSGRRLQRGQQNGRLLVQEMVAAGRVYRSRPGAPWRRAAGQWRGYRAGVARHQAWEARIMTATTPTEDPCIVEPRGFPADLLARLRSWRRCTNAMKTR